MKTLLYSASLGERLFTGSPHRCHLKKPSCPRLSGLGARGPGMGWRRTSEFWIVQSFVDPFVPAVTMVGDGRELKAL